MVNAGWLLWGLMARDCYKPAPGWLQLGVQVLVGCIVMGFFLWLVSMQIDWIGLRTQALQRVGLLALVVLGAVVLYAGTLFLTGLRPRHLSQHGRFET